jgi:molecular chaperone Hsp33
MGETDRVTRAMTSDGAFRVVAAITTETAREAARAQGLSGDDALRLAEFMTGAVLLRETTQPGRRVQILVRDRRGSVLVADSLPDGTNRGIVNPGEPIQGEPAHAPEGDATLQVSYTMPNGGLHQGLVAIARDCPLSTALMQYMQQSEQTVSVIAVAALSGEGDEVAASGGYVVQLLPEVERPALRAMTRHLDELDSLGRLLSDPRTGSRELVSRVLEGFEHDELAHSPLRFGCTCSEERFLRGMASLGPEEVTSLVREESSLEVRCDACGRRYSIEPDTLRAFVLARFAS